MSTQTTAVCRNCALELARIVGERHWWFQFVREPLVIGMRALGWWHNIDATKYRVRHSRCVGCLRFTKSELEERSALFRFLNGIVGKSFSSMRDRRLTASELADAKRFAKEASVTEPDTHARG